MTGCVGFDPTNGSGSEGEGPADGEGSWHQFRGGPGRQGTVGSEGGPGSSPSVDWSVDRDALFDGDELLGGEFSSPIVVGSTVVLTALARHLSGRGLLSKMVALDVESGDVAWAQSLRGADETFGDWLPDPVSDGENVYYPERSGDDPSLAVVDADTGERAGRIKTTALPHAMAVIDEGIYYVAAAGLGRVARSDRSEDWFVEADAPHRLSRWNGLLYYATGTEIVAVDRSSGDTMWRTEFDLPGASAAGRRDLVSPTVVEENGYVAGGLGAFGAREANVSLIAFDTTDGSERWRVDAGDAVEIESEAHALQFLSGRPIAVDGQVIVTARAARTASGDDRAEAILNPGQGDATSVALAADASDGTVRWHAPAPTSFTPVAAGETVYLAHDGGVQVVSDGGATAAVDLDIETGTDRSPALGHGRLFVPGLGTLVALSG